MKTSYEVFKSSLTQLERLQEFKYPLTKAYQTVVFNYGVLDVSEGDECEFYFLMGDKKIEEKLDSELKSITDFETELEITALKFAKLLAAKEEQLKVNLKNWKQ